MALALFPSYELQVWVLALCALTLIYTFVGYPLLVHGLARRWGRPLRPQAGWQPRVAMVIVMHNEAARVEGKLRSCAAQTYPRARLRIVVVSDGSTDDTVRRVQAFGLHQPELRIEVLAFETRRGKAACINEALAACTEEVLVLTDARQALNAQAVAALVETLSDPAVSVVSGELEFLRDGMKDFGASVDAYWTYEKFIRKAEARLHSVPGATGALYAVKRSAFKAIDPHTVLDDVAIPMRACLDGGRVVFDGRALAYDTPARDATQERARKVRTLAGNFQLLALMPALCLPWRNPIWWQFVSHKVLRLLAPWALLGLLLSSALLAPQAWPARVLLGLQLLVYGSVLLSLRFKALLRWRWVRLAAAFVLLNAFAVQGLWAFVRHKDLHRWQAASPAKSPVVAR